MFVSFFLSPRAFFWSSALWAFATGLFWLFMARDMGYLIGIATPLADVPRILGLQVFWSGPFVWFYL